MHRAEVGGRELVDHGSIEGGVPFAVRVLPRSALSLTCR